jgi:RNA polymerase sigma-70 factor (ECF subfamily)
VADPGEAPVYDRDALAAAIGRLRDEDRVVIGCRYLLDLSEAETAAALGVARGTVKSRLSRALGRLREEVQDA